MKELSQPKRAVMLRIDESTKEIEDASQSLLKPYFEDSDTVSRDDSASLLMNFIVTHLGFRVGSFFTIW